MNITQALNVALPEMPAKLVSQRYPRFIRTSYSRSTSKKASR